MLRAPPPLLPYWPWLPERVAVVHIPCVLTYFLTCNYQLDLSGQRGNLACLCQPLPSPAFVSCLSGASLARWCPCGMDHVILYHRVHPGRRTTMHYVALASRLPVELRRQVESSLSGTDAVAMLKVDKNLNRLTKESPTLLSAMLDEQGARFRRMAEELQSVSVQQSGLLSSLVRSEHENAQRSMREERMSGCVTFHLDQLQTIRRELDEERAERGRQASMNAMLMEDLRLRSWEESESRSGSGLIRG